MKSALLLIDIQNDFLPGGSLGVAGGDAVVSVANRLIPLFSILVTSQDWHPPGHCSFDLWPAHCVQGSVGAELAQGLELPENVHGVKKAMDPKIDSFSAFHLTTLAETLREWGVAQTVLLGLTTEYCVKYSALDAAADGFETVVVVDGCRPVDLEGEAKALEEMETAGIRLCTADEIVKERRE